MVNGFRWRTKTPSLVALAGAVCVLGWLGNGPCVAIVQDVILVAAFVGLLWSVYAALRSERGCGVPSPPEHENDRTVHCADP